MAISALPIIAAIIGALVISGSGPKKKPLAGGAPGGSSGGNGSSGNGGLGGGSDPGGGSGGTTPGIPGMPPSLPSDVAMEALFTVRGGPPDLPVGIATYYTGDAMRFHELEARNGVKISTAAQQAANWQPGKKFILPADWHPWSKVLPAQGGFNPKPGTGFPDPVPA